MRGSSDRFKEGLGGKKKLNFGNKQRKRRRQRENRCVCVWVGGGGGDDVNERHITTQKVTELFLPSPCASLVNGVFLFACLLVGWLVGWFLFFFFFFFFFFSFFC